MLNLTSSAEYGGQVYDYAIRQGKTYQFSFYYSADLTGGEIRGQVRDKYAQDNGALLAEFSFSVTYDVVEQKSLVVATISATDTATIPYTRYQGVGDITTRNGWVYDIEYEENGVVVPIAEGLVEVKPEVTV